ncbi:MAG TPA: alpha-amylase family glycosyl hydrolase, partial [Rubrobacteraceae bacterium]|nr:alpha-amylase family glycosyl hydrolase [Rubrobacteraceae bacterium]
MKSRKKGSIQNLLNMTPEARDLFVKVAPTARASSSYLPARDADIFMLRLERYWQDLFDGLRQPYHARADFEEFFTALVEQLAAGYLVRPEELKLLDLERSLTPGWFQDERRVGYVFYVDRFAGDLRGIEPKLPYLKELGVNYVHLMPLLKPRSGPNDGGYAVEDYRTVSPALGTMDGLREVCSALRVEGI